MEGERNGNTGASGSLHIPLSCGYEPLDMSQSSRSGAKVYFAETLMLTVKARVWPPISPLKQVSSPTLPPPQVWSELVQFRDATHKPLLLCKAGHVGDTSAHLE